MCNVWCNDFGLKVKKHILPESSLLEVGSRNVNGSLRELFTGTVKEYVGVDIFDGPGVDQVVNVLDLGDAFNERRFDMVLSTEMLEHCFEWKDALFQMLLVLKQGGILLVTTRSPGFELHDYPADHWRFSKDDFAKIFSPVGDVLELESDMTLGWACGVGIIIRKTCDNSALKKWRDQLDQMEVYSMQAEMKAKAAVLTTTKPDHGIEQVIFDQYSRYQACADLIRQTGFISGNSVLDIGSGPECLFGRFMLDASMNFVDPLIPDTLVAGRIKGDIFCDQLNGKTFDYVTAVDVLEHVPAEFRTAFLERLVSLSQNIVVLGFPTRDSCDALEVDQAVDDKYQATFGVEYPWLKEHHEFGLPSLSETIEFLNQAGWHCQTIGHGHAPWLQELLAFVICAWDVDALKEIVLEASQQFNQVLYSSDFKAPHYRQFLVASRKPLPSLIPPVSELNEVESESAFQELMTETREKCLEVSMQKLKECDAAVRERDAAVSERDVVVRERDALVDERDVLVDVLARERDVLASERDVFASERNVFVKESDALVKESDALVRERDAALSVIEGIWMSSSWRLTRPLRLIARLARYGLTTQDRSRITQGLRHRYHRLPLPSPVKSLIRSAYSRVFLKAARSLSRSAFQATQFHPPSNKPVPQIQGSPDYFVWGVIDWHFRHQRPQQLALALAATGRRIFYISPVLAHDEREGFDAEMLDASGQLFQLKLFAKNAPSIYANAPSLEIVDQLRGSIGAVMDWANCKQIVSLVDHPFWLDVASVLPDSRLVYDCMDHHEGFGNNAASLTQLEKRLLSESDLTITTSTWLDDAIAPHAKHRALIRNAGDYQHFSQVPKSVYRDPHGRRVIGYYGAIAEWFDVGLVEEVAKQHPDCSVLLIGRDTVNARGRLAKLNNVTFTDEVPYSQLPYYLYGFDVCLLPFKIIPLTLATNPVKAYEYLGAGKPIVTVDLPEMVQFEGLVYVAADKEAFLAAVSNVLSQPEPDSLLQKRKSFAQGQTWQHRTEAFIQKAESTANDPKVSVVVVTYNNLDFTRACLKSLDEHSQYEQMEIIVVDNASSDGTPAYLSEWVANGDNRQLILNDDNRGFAAANNQGLNVATGEYLVLLNNDTYVTPGWIRTLVRHLQRDKTIGLIGPVTNNIGNEAKIDIAYANMDEMLVKSTAYTHRHIGQTFPLRTAAFFCVMLPRATFRRVGTLDEAFGRGFFEDDDYCRRIEQIGLRVACAEDVFIHHHLSASFNKLKQQDRQKLFEDNKKIYEAKWGEWVPHGYRIHEPMKQCQSDVIPDVFSGQKYIAGNCVVCSKTGRFFYQDVALWRESLNCQHCRSTSRYRSIAGGLLRAINELTGVDAPSLEALPRASGRRLRVYDTQPPFYYEPCAYPLPDLLKATGWIDVELSNYKPNKPMGTVLAQGITNQNLECLTFADESLDIVITSDVMEHVRLDDQAHREICRVLKPGGVYIFTVPHDRSWEKTLTRVQINDPDDPSKDVHLLEPEYHGDTNSDSANGVLAYRTYGRDIEKHLSELGFTVNYSRKDAAGLGILNTELYYCRKSAC
jgi:GT2 family glycosyltransferase/2-polyprenyl-3-methyl-5-hydroxy-6-metoxy-1,4-benzoquinol methylase